MAGITGIWCRILEWFQDRRDRTNLIMGFNRSARQAFVAGISPVLLKASISRGERSYKHQFSNFLNSGFRIMACSGRQLSKQDIVNIGLVVLNDSMLVRRLVVLGWDTLEVHCDVGNHGCRWQLHDYIMLGQGGSDEY